MNKKIITLGLVITTFTSILTGCNIYKFAYDKSSKNTVKNEINVQEVNCKYENGLKSIYEQDKVKINEKYSLPNLQRMSKEDEEKYLGSAQVLKRINDLNISTEDFLTPEKSWKDIYNTSKSSVYDEINKLNETSFKGKTSSELNTFIKDNPNSKILIESSEIEVDETINVTSNVFIDGSGKCKLICNSDVDKAIMFEKAENSGVCGIILEGKFNYGIYVIESKKLLIKKNEISNLNNKAIVVMGTNSQVNIISNYIHENNHGAIFINGNSSNGVIEKNTLLNNDGKENLTAGIVLGSLIINDMYTAYNEHQDVYLYELKDAPNNNVIIDNVIEDGHSSGIYSDGGYMNYIVENQIENNDKEGICLDYGTFGTYVSENVIRNNGGRSRQSDEDLARDFISEFGRLENGSSPAKLPGISIDNSAYNTIHNNTIKLNYGSGVKMVRSAYRNTIILNNISDNNLGESEKFHFFAIEIGHASKPDEPVKGLDFTADYENIICRNNISGRHYAGIFLAEESYINDIFDNTIMDSEVFSMECLSNKFNNSVNNLANKESRGISLSDNKPIISLPNTVN